jgi:gliding motility-associated-like protein
MKTYKIIILYLLLLYPFAIVSARHIVGGEIYYTWLRREGNNNVYRFTLNVYLDCNPDAQRTFDNVAALSIYTKSNNRLVNNTGVRLGQRTRVEKPDNPCLIPPNVCVERGVYEWEQELPVINDTYIVMYQICCRNETTNNLIAPRIVGNTYTVEITSAGQNFNNNSPRFRSFPPTIICVDERLNYDHSASDAENDVVVYRFCDPLGGGGSTIGFGCNNTTPNPACWPVLNAVFRPPYTATDPVGGNPRVRINPQTGLITGTPNLQGQFAVVVCAEEYRNGRLLSIVKRDFQFNVAPCQPVVKARMKADEFIDDTYIFRSCGDLTFTVENQSIVRENIRNLRFDINIKGENKRFTEFNPVITFPDTGIYRGTLLLNEGLQCNDSVNLEFRISPTVRPDFTIQYDTCQVGPVQFSSTTPYTSADRLKWSWNFDGLRDSVINPIVRYEKAGVKTATLTATNRFNCSNSITKRFTYAPIPNNLISTPIKIEACTPATILFNNLSSPIDSTYSISWDFGDNSKSNRFNPSYTYTKAGVYTIAVNVVSPSGCRASQRFNNVAVIKEGVKADFTYDFEPPLKRNSTVALNSVPSNANSWSWFHNNRFFARGRTASINFRDTGLQKIQLFVTNINECTDSITKILDVAPIDAYFLPNAFTPNYDGQNDIYKGEGVLEGIQAFNMKIFNRWGEMIFETNNPNEGWNGAKFNGTRQSPQGVYLCLVTYTTARGERRGLRSYATLLH